MDLASGSSDNELGVIPLALKHSVDRNLGGAQRSMLLLVHIRSLGLENVFSTRSRYWSWLRKSGNLISIVTRLALPLQAVFTLCDPAFCIFVPSAYQPP